MLYANGWHIKPATPLHGYVVWSCGHTFFGPDTLDNCRKWLRDNFKVELNP